MTSLLDRISDMVRKSAAHVRHSETCPCSNPSKCTCGVSDLLQDMAGLVEEIKDSYKLTEDHKNLLISYLDGPSKVMTQTGWTIDEFNAAVSEAHLGQCPNCKIWCDDDDLISEGEYDGRCNKCR